MPSDEIVKLQFEQITESLKRIEKNFEKLESENKKEIEGIKKEQTTMREDYLKFKTKVLTWASAGGVIGGFLSTFLSK